MTTKTELLRIKKWQKANPEKVRGYHRRWLEKNPDKAKLYAERARERSKKYYKANKDKCLAASRAYVAKNKEKISLYLRDYHMKYKKPPHSARKRTERHLQRTYGMTMEQFDAMIIKQNGLCGICREELRRPYVDHDHKTGEVRGVLCVRCNVFLGLYDDKPWVVDNLFKYLGR